MSPFTVLLTSTGSERPTQKAAHRHIASPQAARHAAAKARAAHPWPLSTIAPAFPARHPTARNALPATDDATGASAEVRMRRVAAAAASVGRARAASAGLIVARWAVRSAAVRRARTGVKGRRIALVAAQMAAWSRGGGSLREGREKRDFLALVSGSA